ncbi:MAG TPA: glycosyltransferase family 2 protein, partial [Pirellulales bacterium]|nr:glycosyltransferase family 2 protein [Pirellulales bacterium]
MELSIVGSMYQSAPYLREFHRRVCAAAAAVTAEYELVLVNDGSPDDSLAIARELAADDPHVTIVDLSRNFGHHQAASAGLAHSSGDRVFLIDLDLEEQPEWLARFWTALDASGADVIYGVLPRRRGGLVRRWSGGLFYKAFNLLSETAIPENPCTVRLMTRRYVDALLSLRDASLFLAGNFAWTGFEQIALPVETTARAGASTYTLARRLRLFLDAVTSFTSYPLHAVFAVGAAISLLAGTFGAVLVGEKLLRPDSTLLGWSSVMASIWLLGGLTIGSVGLIGLYISRIFAETKHRPPYIVREVLRGSRRAAAEEAATS